MHEKRSFQVKLYHFHSGSYQLNSFSYRFGHISRTLRALQSSTKTSLRIDEEGLLSLQFLMPSPKPKGAAGATSDAFIEFRVSIQRIHAPSFSTNSSFIKCLALDEDV